MLAEDRRREGDLAGGLGELQRMADGLHRPGRRMLDLDHHFAGQRMGVFLHLLDVVDRPGRHARE